jgi:hypothetical protein
MRSLLPTLAGLLLAGLAFSSPASSQPFQVTLEMDASGDSIHTLDRPYGLAVNSWNDVYVGCLDSQNVFVRYGHGGVDQFFDAGLEIRDLAMGPDDRLYVAAQGGGLQRLWSIDLPGNPTLLMDESSGIDDPHQLIYAQDGMLYLSGGLSDDVLRIDPDTGAWQRVLDSSGDGFGAIADEPLGLAMDANGDLYVGCAQSDNVFRIPGGTGAPELVSEDLDGASFLQFDGGDLLVSAYLANEVIRIDFDDTESVVIDGDGDGSTSMSLPGPMTMDPLGNLYVSGMNSHNVFCVRPDGTIQLVMDSSGDGVEPLDSPRHLVVDLLGRVHVSGIGSDNVFRLADLGSWQSGGYGGFLDGGTFTVTLDAAWPGKPAGVNPPYTFSDEIVMWNRGTGKARILPPGATSGMEIELLVNGETFHEDFEIVNSVGSLGEVVIALTGSGSAFDSASGSDTPATEVGRDYTWQQNVDFPSDPVVSDTLSDPVPGTGDLHRTLTLDYGNNNITAPFVPRTHVFQVDTDAIRTSGGPRLTWPWTNLGYALRGYEGVLPDLSGFGTYLLGTDDNEIILTNVRPGAVGAMFYSWVAIYAPFRGGVLVPQPDFQINMGANVGEGSHYFQLPGEGPLPVGFSIYFQWWFLDDDGPQGVSSTNGLRLGG